MWWPSCFDVTLGFPGEGPPAQVFMAPLGRPPDDEWLTKASRVLHGVEAFTGQGLCLDCLCTACLTPSLCLIY